MIHDIISNSANVSSYYTIILHVYILIFTFFRTWNTFINRLNDTTLVINIKMNDEQEFVDNVGVRAVLNRSHQAKSESRNMSYIIGD